MNRRRSVALAVCGLMAALLSMSADDGNAKGKFAGTWQAKFKGRVFCVLKIDAGESISGTLSPGKVTVNDQGDLVEAEAWDGGEQPILNPKPDGDKLAFEWKDAGDNDAVRFELKVTGQDAAELRPAGEGAPNIKPILLERAKTGA